MTEIKCAGCGNDGSNGGLFLAVDARWNPKRGAWELNERDDHGGTALDCLNCDHQTEIDRGAIFPYGVALQPDGTRLFESTLEAPADAERDAPDGYCEGCGRESLDCSLNPCAAVIRDRGETELGDSRVIRDLPVSDNYESVDHMLQEVLNASDLDALAKHFGPREAVTGLVLRYDYERNVVEKWATDYPPDEPNAEFRRFE